MCLINFGLKGIYFDKMMLFYVNWDFFLKKIILKTNRKHEKDVEKKEEVISRWSDFLDF